MIHPNHSGKSLPDTLVIASRSTREPGDASFGGRGLRNIDRLYEYWEQARGDRAMPRRADIDPTEFPALLPGIILLDVEGTDSDSHGRYRYRVVGTREVRNRGFDPTGKLVNEGFLGVSLEDALATYDLVCERRTFLFDPIVCQNERGIWIDENSILLPLSEDGDTVSQILVYSERREAKPTS